jgi:predicted cupin superfamily sugar epimerase
MDADPIIELLGLEPHPESGWYRETYRDEASSAIWFLLRSGERSNWHRVRGSSEIWHHYRGDPIALSFERDGRVVTEQLGPDLANGERPQLVVPPDAWQSAEPAPGRPHGYTLVGCTVAPPFRFETFELAPEGWEP